MNDEQERNQQQVLQQNQNTDQTFTNTQLNVAPAPIDPTFAPIAENKKIPVRLPIAKTIASYLIRFYIVVILAAIAIYLYYSPVDSSGFMGGFAILGAIMTAAPIAGLVVLIINSLITAIAIRKFFQSDSCDKVNWLFVVKGCLAAILAYLIIDLIIIAVGFLVNDSTDYIDLSDYLFYIMYPIALMPLLLHFLRHELINRKTVAMFFVWVSLVIIAIQLYPLIWSIVSSLSFNYMSWLVLVYDIIIPVIGYMVFSVPACVVSLMILKNTFISDFTTKRNRMVPIYINIAMIIIVTALIILI